MREEKKEEVAISTEQNKFVSWLDNYWYHYKWPTIVAIFFVLVFTISIVQSCSTERNDIIVTYAGGAYLEDSDRASIETVLSSSLPEGFSGQDSPKSGFSSYFVLTKEQILELQEETDFNGDKKNPQINSSFIASEQQTFINQLQTGQNSILLLDIELYKSLFLKDGKSDQLMSLNDIFGNVPNGAVDDYCISLYETDMFKNYRGLRSLPEDTVICIMRKLYHQSEETYSKQVEAFKSFAQSSASN